MGIAALIATLAEYAYSAAISYAISVVANQVISAFSDVPDQGDNGLAAQGSGRQQLIRSGISSRKVIFGQTRVSGPMAYATGTGLNSGFLWYVIPLHHGEAQAIDDVYLNDAVVPNDVLNAAGYVISGQFTGIGTGIAIQVLIKKHLGAVGQIVDADLAAADPNWTAAHTGDGVTYLVVRLLWNQTIFPTGMPNVSALVRGQKLYDPRDGLTKYSTNWALCVRHYLTADYGLNCDSTEIDDTSFIAAANICDERVLMPTPGSPPSAALQTLVTVDPDTDRITGNLAELLQTGDGVRFSTTGVLPTPLVVGTTYYWIRSKSGVGRVTTTPALAFAFERGSPSTAIDLGTAGTGTHTMVYYDQMRYDCQGVVDLGDAPMKILKDLMSAAGGSLVYQQGTWRIYAAAYRAPTGGITADDLRGPVKIATNVPRKELFNGVRGIYIDPNNAYQPGDFPIVTNDTYATEDGGEILRDIALPYTNNSFRAQRIAKIFVEKSRQSLSGTFPLKMTGFKYQVCDNVPVTIAQLGFSALEMSVRRWIFNPAGGVDLQMQKEAASSYSWSGSDAHVQEPPPNTTLPNPLSCPTITGLALSSGTADLFIAGDGTVHSRIHATWVAVVNSFVNEGGRIEVQFALAAGSPQEWQSMPNAAGTASDAYIVPVNDGIAYYVQVRAVNSYGVEGDWTTSGAHTVVGKTAVPSDVTGLSAVQQTTVVVIGCNAVTDTDLDSVEVRLGDAGTTSWSDASPLVNLLRGQTATTAAIPPGSWELFAKAKDTSGNYSANAAMLAITVTSDGFNAIASTQYAPGWNKGRIAPAKLTLSGVAGNYLSCSISPVTGDLSVRAYIRAVDYTPGTLKDIASVYGAAGNRAWHFYIDTNGKQSLIWSVDGTNTITKNCSVALTVIDGAGIWVGFDFDVNYLGIASKIRFGHAGAASDAEPDGIFMIQTGGDVVTAGVTSIFASTAPLEIGSRNGGTAGLFVGDILRCAVYAGLTATNKVADFDARDGRVNGNPFTSSRTGETYTLHSTNTALTHFTGSLVKHWTGVLVPASQSLASALDWEVFDQFVPDAYADGYFETDEIDTGIDGTLRLYADIVSVLGPGEATGVADPQLEVETRAAAGSYDGFAAWTIGNASFRYVKARIHVDTDIGEPVISGFEFNIDGPARTENGTLTVDGSGTGTVTFGAQFHSAPVLQVSPSGSGDVSASYASLSGDGFTGYFKTGGVAGAGTLSWTATGL